MNSLNESISKTKRPIVKNFTVNDKYLETGGYQSINEAVVRLSLDFPKKLNEETAAKSI